MPAPAPIHTQRLVLRAFSTEDVPAMARWCDTLEISDMLLSMPHPYTGADAEHYLREMVLPGYESGERFSMAVTLDGELIGGVGLNLAKEHSRAELGYWVAVPHWGKGYASEAGAAMVRFGFEKLGLNKIYASHFPRNPASGRVLEKIGMRREGVLRRHIVKWGCPEDLVMYAILREEFGG